MVTGPWMTPFLALLGNSSSALDCTAHCPLWKYPSNPHSITLGHRGHCLIPSQALTSCPPRPAVRDTGKGPIPRGPNLRGGLGPTVLSHRLSSRLGPSCHLSCAHSGTARHSKVLPGMWQQRSFVYSFIVYGLCNQVSQVPAFMEFTFPDDRGEQ